MRRFPSMRDRRSRALGFLLLGLGGLASLRAQATPADAAQRIQEAESKLGSAPGTVVLDRPARLDRTVTLGAGHALVIAAPFTVGNASIRLAGHNDVRCTAPITAENGVDLFLADGTTDVSVHGCNVKVTGRPGGYLLTATRTAHVHVADNQLLNIAIFNTHNTGGTDGRSTDVTLTGNSTIFKGARGPIGIYLLFVVGGNVSGNHLEGTGHGVEWWGGDANEGWPGVAAINSAGKLTITHNDCKDPGGACVWGSDGFDISVGQNTTDSCGDVCFDTEGGVRTNFTGNIARHCGNGCLAAEFESQDAVFTGNTAIADGTVPEGPLVLIKHPSGRVPNHVNLVVSGNTLVCTKLCSALYSEGEDGFTFSKNIITDGFLQFMNYTNNVAITDNTLRFQVPVGTASGIGGPTLSNGHHSEISGNQILAQAGVDGDAPCIGQSWSDYNNADEMRITGNTCAGFRTGIATRIAGGNPGAPHAVWILSGNHFIGIPAAKQIVHEHKSGNESYTSTP